VLNAIWNNITVANILWNTLKNPRFSLPLKKYPWKSWNYNPPLKIVLKQTFCASLIGFAVLLHICSCKAVEEDPWSLWEKNGVPFVIQQAASFSNNKNEIWRKIQNELWISTSRRSICDRHFFKSKVRKVWPMNVKCLPPGPGPGGLLQALLPLTHHIEIANKSSPLLNSLYFLSSCGYEAEFYRDHHTPTLLLYPGLRPALMSPLRLGNKQRQS